MNSRWHCTEVDATGKAISDASSRRLTVLTNQLGETCGTLPEDSSWRPGYNCLAACRCSAALGSGSVLGPFLAPAEVSGCGPFPSQPTGTRAHGRARHDGVLEQGHRRSCSTRVGTRPVRASREKG